MDTNVMSELRKPRPDAGVIQWLSRTHPHEVHVSVVTIGEIRRGITRLQHRGDHRQATMVESWLRTIRDQHRDRIIPVDLAVAEEWGHMTAPGTSPEDALIAATAKVHGWTVITRNVKDFEPTGVRLLNPFTA